MNLRGSSSASPRWGAILTVPSRKPIGFAEGRSAGFLVFLPVSLLTPWSAILGLLVQNAFVHEYSLTNTSLHAVHWTEPFLVQTVVP
jgi:hypothetical protein